MGGKPKSGSGQPHGGRSAIHGGGDAFTKKGPSLGEGGAWNARGGWRWGWEWGGQPASSAPAYAGSALLPRAGQRKGSAWNTSSRLRTTGKG